MSRDPATSALPTETTEPAASSDARADSVPLWAGDADGAVMVAQQAPVQFDLGQTYAAVGVDGDAQAWDANVPLVVDAGLFSNIDATLDMLTVSPDLFDIPALDAGGGDASAT
jgi:hypothetical protein